MDRLTGIRLKNSNDGDGIAEYGLKTHEEMIIKIKQYAEHQRKILDEIINADDDEFITETYLGAIAMRDRKIVEPKEGE